MAMNQNPLQSGEAAALLRNPERLKALLSAPETRQLMGMLNRQKGDLNLAAQKAQKGDLSSLSDMIGQLMNTREGAELAQQVQRKMK